MAKGYKLYIACPVCGGTGIKKTYGTGGSAEGTCPYCGGDGMIFWGWCTEDTFDMPSVTVDAENP